MNRLLNISALSALLAASACGGTSHPHDPPPLRDRFVAIEVEVYDKNNPDLVWEDVGVRIVQADQEWSGCICVNPVPDDWYYTDEFGVVFLDAVDLAVADVGFLEDGGEAVISPDLLEDEVTVLLEISAPGLGTVYRSVELSWDEPSVFVSIPF